MDKTVKDSWWQEHRPTTRRLVQLYSALLHNAYIKGFMRSFLIIQNVSSWTTKKFLMPIIQGTRQRKRLSNLSCQMGKNKSEC